MERKLFLESCSFMLQRPELGKSKVLERVWSKFLFNGFNWLCVLSCDFNLFAE